MIKPLLLVMNPRRIARCITAIESLPIDKVWMTAMWEKELEPVIDKIVDDVIAGPDGYTHLILLSDDTVPTPKSLALVLAALEEGHPVVTGYCNLDSKVPHVNLTKSPFKHVDQSYGNDYDWFTRDEVEAWPDPIVPTCFGGACLTAMSRELWKQFPFRCNTHPGAEMGYCSDWNLCVRLQAAGIPIVAPRGAFVHHVKEDWTSMVINDPEKRLLNGLIPSEVRYDYDIQGLTV